MEKISALVKCLHNDVRSIPLALHLARVRLDQLSQVTIDLVSFFESRADIVLDLQVLTLNGSLLSLEPIVRKGGVKSFDPFLKFLHCRRLSDSSVMLKINRKCEFLAIEEVRG